MNRRKQMQGLLARAGYLLSCYKFTAFRADFFVLVLLSAGAALLGWRGWKRGWSVGHLLGIAACLMGFATLWWLRRREYTIFVPWPNESTSASGPMLDAEEKLSLSGSGHFGVAGVKRRFMDIASLLWITELGEYVVMGRFQLRNVPLLNALPEEQGMWYIFLRPTDIVDLQVGELYCGWQAQRAVRVTYMDEKELERQLYLSCPTKICQQRLWAELTGRQAAS